MQWLHAFWFHYGYPSLLGNGPEDAISTLTKGAIVLALMPVLRKMIGSELRRVHADLLGLNHEVKAVTRDFAKPCRWLWRQLKKLARVRLTVKAPSDLPPTPPAPTIGT